MMPATQIRSETETENENETEKNKTKGSDNFWRCEKKSLISRSLTYFHDHRPAVTMSAQKKAKVSASTRLEDAWLAWRTLIDVRVPHPETRPRTAARIAWC